MVIISSLPHRKPFEASLFDVLALDDKGFHVVERNHDLGRLVVHVRLKETSSDGKYDIRVGPLNSLTASVVAVVDTGRWVPFPIQKPVFDKAPHRKGTTRSLMNPTDIDAAKAALCISEWLVRSVELWVCNELSLGALNERIMRCNAEGVAVRCDTEYNLVEWYSSGSPCFDSRDRRADLVSWGSTCVIQRRVWSNTR